MHLPTAISPSGLLPRLVVGLPHALLEFMDWLKVALLGETPSMGAADLKFLLLSAYSPAMLNYSGDQAGLTAHYMLRWSRREVPGPWSDTASATVVRETALG